MALLTQKAIMATFQEMLEEMSFDKITVSALVKRSGISSNTFYYHYQDIYALLDKWLTMQLSTLQNEQEASDWKTEAKNLFHTCQDHSRVIYHIYDSLSREQLERYVFSSTDDSITKQIRLRVEGTSLSEKHIVEITEFCKYAFLGFFLKFLWNKMEGNVDEDVDRLSKMFENFVNGEISNAEKTN